MKYDNFARAFAVLAHGDQKYGDAPYSIHLDAVADIVREGVSEEDTLPVVVAYLHDLLEDTKVTADELRSVFGDEVSEAVSYVTDPVAKNRRERKRLLHERLATLEANTPSGRAALLVKTADRLANVRSCVADNNSALLEMYAREHAAFTAATYRKGLCEAWWDELNLVLLSRASR